MYSHLNKLVCAAAAMAFCASQAMASASAPQPVGPLIAVSVYGTQASAQAVCSQTASAALSAGAAAAVQGQPGCVLPATDIPPPMAQDTAGPPPPPANGISGAEWLLIGLDSLIALAGLATLFDDDDDDGDSISPA